MGSLRYSTLLLCAVVSSLKGCPLLTLYTWRLAGLTAICPVAFLALTSASARAFPRPREGQGFSALKYTPLPREHPCVTFSDNDSVDAIVAQKVLTEMGCGELIMNSL
jgi:hypothetical protein